MRNIAKIVALCVLPAMLAGCWSYRSLNDISIVTGMGVDLLPGGDGVRVTYEIVDFSGDVKGSSPKSKIVVSEGATLLDATRNAKRRLLNRLYINNLEVVAISEDLAQNLGISGIVDLFLRDAECRETINMLIAQGMSAESLLSQEGTDQGITSIALDSIVSEDPEITSSTTCVELYQAYFMLSCPGASLSLPVIHTVQNGEETVVESNGIAGFDGDRLAGFLTPEESKYFLIATDKCKGGILPLDTDGNGQFDMSLEIQDNRTKVSFTVQNGQPHFRIDTVTDIFMAETLTAIDVMDGSVIADLERLAADDMRAQIERVVGKAQHAFKSDILGFGHVVYQRDVELWKRIEKGWEAIFQTVPVDISCRVNIKNSAFIKSREGSDR